MTDADAATHASKAGDRLSVDAAIEFVTAAAWLEPPDLDAAPEAIKRARAFLIAFDAEAALGVLDEWCGQQRKMIHTFAGFGMDVSLDYAIERLRSADEIGWSPSILSHDLVAIEAPDKAISFDVRMPGRER